MATDRFYIGPYDKDSGLQTNYKPYAIPDNAFSMLQNAYVFRGRVRKRFGSRWFADSVFQSRLAIAVGTTTGGSLTGTLFTILNDTGLTLTVGQAFSVGTLLFTVVDDSGIGAHQMLRTDGSLAAATLNLTSSVFNITATGAADGTIVYFYPALPVMGLLTAVTSFFVQQLLIGFDTRYAYQYIGGWQRLNLEATNSGESVWTGSNNQFFWGSTWTGINASQPIFFVSNFNTPDGIRYFNLGTSTWNFFNYPYSKGSLINTTDGGGNANGSTGAGTGKIGQVFVIGQTLFTVVVADGALAVEALTSAPTVGTGTYNIATGNYTFTTAMINTAIYWSGSNFINTALIIVPFKNRLILLNTVENGTSYTNRCRYSQVGSPLDPAAWLQDVPGRGNAIDASTTEAIISSEFIKDRLIVYFEYSTWELVYTGNQAYPFTWQKINTELGAESTFSVVPFDKIVLAIDSVGINACNGANVERIDDKIPTTIFQIHNGFQDEGLKRVYGIRDYFLETVYWTYPDESQTDSTPFPNKVLVYNYKTGTWAINDDSITCFGYYQPTEGILWSSQTVTWDDAIPWNSGATQAYFREVAAGNQEGFTFICDDESTTNAPAIQITNLTVINNIVTITAINHNYFVGQYLYFSGITDSGNIGTLVNGTIQQVTSTADVNTFTFSFYDTNDDILVGMYNGGGIIATVSNINIRTKEYNFYANQGRNAYISKIDCMVDRTAYGQIAVNTYSSTSFINLLTAGQVSGTIMGTANLDTFAYPDITSEAFTTRLWHPVFLQSEGEYVQLQFQLNNEQMLNPNIRDADFQLHGILIFATPTTSRLQ